MTTIEAFRLTDRDLIEAIVQSYYFLDYGIISKVSTDKRTVDVLHARLLNTIDGKPYAKPTETTGVELLTLSGAGFSLNWDIVPGDKALLLALKDYVEDTSKVKSPEQSNVYVHYRRENLKAVPLCAFSDESKVRLTADKGKFKIETQENTEIDSKATVKVQSAAKIELNGNTKQFVTWAELNTALQQCFTLIKNHTHIVNTTGGPTAQTGTANPSISLSTATLDISSSQTQTIVTGG